VSVSDAPYVFVVDDDPSVRSSLWRLLVSDGLRVATFGSAREFLEDPRVGQPGCIVIDLLMPGTSGLQLQAELKRRGLDQPVIFLTGHGDVTASVQAMKGGAMDFLQKPAPPDILIASVRAALAREQETRERRARAATARSRLDTLSPRERQVYELIVRGMLNKQVAHALGITEKTVKIHRGRVMQKMQTRSLAELVRTSQHLER
jgi:FixJ family two-component response regulator